MHQFQGLSTPRKEKLLIRNAIFEESNEDAE
jgi:hypothetical protein